MRITKPIRKQIYDDIVEKAYPSKAIRKMAEPLVNYLLLEKSEAFNDGVRTCRDNPDYVIPSNALRFIARVSTDRGYTSESCEMVLPVHYAVKNPFEIKGGNTLTFSTEPMLPYADDYGLDLPDEMKDVIKGIFSVLRKKGDFRMALRSLDAYHTTIELIKAIPEAEDVVKEVLNRSNT